jgi:hypothetical protein
MSRFVIGAAKFMIVLGFLMTLVIQFFVIPVLAADTVRYAPDVAYLRWPGILGCVAIVLCAQVVLVCTWRLLTLVTTRDIFTMTSLRYVNVMIGAFVAASALFVVANGVLSGASALSSGTMLLTVMGAAACLGFALVLWVMRSLLTQAVGFKNDLAEVI